jgi:hypothetical protein
MAACEGNQGDVGKQDSMQELESNLQDLQLGDNAVEFFTPGADALYVVLFNVEGPHKIVDEPHITAPQRRQAMENVLRNDILPKCGQDLFLLCQEVKTKLSDNIIRAAMGMAPRLSEDSTELEDEELYAFEQKHAALLGSEELLNLNRDAEIYFKQFPKSSPVQPNPSPATASYSVHLLDTNTLLQQAYKYQANLIGVSSPNDIPIFIARMTVCVLLQRSTARPITLLVSWHGPWNIKIFGYGREITFRSI